MDMSASSNRLVLLIAVALLLSILGLMITNDYVMDDALITLRYSYNLGQLGHPIWNEADISDRSMGYTTPLWMLLNALPAVLTDSRDVLITSARLISLVALASIIVVISKDVDRRRISASAKLAIVIGIFGQVGFAFHVNSAMETILFSCFVLLSIMAHIRYPKSAWSLVFGTLAFLTRPEGALIVALLMLDYLRSKEVFRLVTRAVVFGLFALLLVTFMVLYYGDPLPNSFYVKQESGLSPASITQTVFFVLTIAFPFAALSLFGALKLRNHQSVIATSGALILLGYYLTVAPLMNVLSRYQWPVLVMLILGSIPALEYLIASKYRYRRAILVLIALSLAVVNAGNLLGSAYFATATGKSMSNLILMGKALAPLRVDDQWLVYHDAGAVCYFSNWNCFDTIGLNNRAVAKGEITLDEILRLENSAVAMQNIDLSAVNAEVRQRDLIAHYAEYGFEYVDTYITLREAENREFGVMVFARDPSTVRLALDQAQLRPDIDSQIFYDVYAFARWVVKGR